MTDYKSERIAWSNMLGRCRNPRIPSFKNYGGRGITVCDRWFSFKTFLLDMGLKPSPKLTLERIDNDGNYEPGNCQWATRFQQIHNRRHPKPLSEKSISKMRTSLTGRSLSVEHKQRIGLALKGCKKSLEHRQKMVGRIVSEETRRKLSIVGEGRKASEEARRNMSLAALNRRICK